MLCAVVKYLVLFGCTLNYGVKTFQNQTKSQNKGKFTVFFGVCEFGPTKLDSLLIYIHFYKIGLNKFPYVKYI